MQSQAKPKLSFLTKKEYLWELRFEFEQFYTLLFYLLWFYMILNTFMWFDPRLGSKLDSCNTLVNYLFNQTRTTIIF